jgi:tetratricopeptide (TPR) repeat protein
MSDPASARMTAIEALFDEAKALAPERRSAWLAQRCANDAELRAEVEALLALEPRARGFLEEPADPWTGRVIDRWRTVRRIGAGGMGVVYLAERADGAFEQKAALKLLKTGVEHAEILDRFRRERQLLAGLDHENIARLIDGGATADGIPYFVMEYVAGTRIDEWCDARRLPVARRLALFRDVCAAASYAHRNLVVHRDLKPSNILVTDAAAQGPERPDGTIKLVDFGIAKLLAPVARQEDARTVERRLTPEYASPEVILGGSVTTASDVFSLGVVLYELLTGRRPWRVDETTSQTALEQEICGRTPPPPSAAAITPEAAAARGTNERELRAALRGDLDAIVMTALATEPGRRYASANDLSEDLRRHLAHEPIVARKPGAAYLFRKFVRRRRALVAAAAVALLALAAGAGGLVAGTLKARREALSTARVNQLLREMLIQLDPSSALGFAKSLNKQLDYASQKLDQGLLRDEPEIEVDLRATLGRVYGALGFAGWSRRESAHALELAQRVWPADDGRRIALLLALGWSERNCGANDDSAGHLQAAADLAARIPGKEGERAHALLELGLTLTELGRLDDADTALREALERTTKSDGAESEAVAGIQTALAVNLLAQGDLEEAEPIARAGLATREKLYPGGHPQLPFSLDALGRVLRALEQYDEAERLFERSLKLRRQLFDPKSPMIAYTLELLAEVKSASGRPREAIPLLEEVLASRRKYYEANSRPVVNALLELGLAHAAAGAPARGRTCLEEALKIADLQKFASDPLLERGRAEFARETGEKPK